MEVGELEDGEALERLGQLRRANEIPPELDLRRVAQAPPIETRGHEDGADRRMTQGQVLDVEEVDALTEDLRLVILLDAEALARMATAEALLQDR